MSAEVDHYQILGVSSTAAQNEITDAYKALLRTQHPDKVAPNDKHAANAKTALINAAYRILNDPTKRKDYDLKRAAAKQSPRVDPRPGPPARPKGSKIPGPSTPVARPPVPNIQRPVNRPKPPTAPTYPNAPATAHGVYYPKHDPEHLYFDANGTPGLLRHSLDTADRDKLRMMMLAHKYGMNVVEWPFRPGTDAGHFVFDWTGKWGQLEVWIDAKRKPPT